MFSETFPSQSHHDVKKSRSGNGVVETIKSKVRNDTVLATGLSGHGARTREAESVTDIKSRSSGKRASDRSSEYNQEVKRDAFPEGWSSGNVSLIFPDQESVDFGFTELSTEYDQVADVAERLGLSAEFEKLYRVFLSSSKKNQDDVRDINSNNQSLLHLIFSQPRRQKIMKRAPEVKKVNDAIIFFNVEQIQKSSDWNAKTVIVPVVYDEWDSGWPGWVSTRNRTHFVYQKRHPQLNHLHSHSPNHGHDGGGILSFMIDFYHKLPEMVIFTHAKPYEHNKNFQDWIDCLRPNVSYVTINEYWIRKRGVSFWGPKCGIVERCWRNLATIFNVSAAQIPPRTELEVSMYCCQQFAISRAQIRSKPLATYLAAHRAMGLRDKCHGNLPLNAPNDDLYCNAPSSPSTPIQYDWPNCGKDTQAGATEHLAHVVYGDLPMRLPRRKFQDWCAYYRPQHECPGSPCMVQCNDYYQENGARVAPCYSFEHEWPGEISDEEPKKREL